MVKRARRPLPVAVLAALALSIFAVVARRDDPDPVVRTLSLGPRLSGVAVDERTGRAFVGVSDAAAVTGRVAVLDTATGALLGATPLPDSPTGIVVDEQSGRVFVSESAAGSAGVAMLDARSGRLLRALPAGPYPAALAVDRRAGRLFVASPDLAACPHLAVAAPCSRIAVFDAASGRPLRAFKAPGHVVDVAVDARAGRLVVVGDDGTHRGIISVLDAAGGQLLRSVRIGAQPGFPPGHALAVDEATDRAFALGAGYSGFTTGHVYVLDTRDGALLRAHTTDSLPTSVAVDGGAGRVFVLTLGPVRRVAGGGIVPTGAGSVRILDARGGAVVRTLPAGVAALVVAADTRGGRALVANMGALSADGAGVFDGVGSVTIVDGRAGTVARTIPVGVYPTGLAVDARRRRAFVVNSGGTVRVRDPWGWVPPWLRRVLPFVPRPPRPTRDIPSSVTVLDISH